VNLTFGSLFSGVGGFDLGFHRSGWKCEWMVEFDENAAGVLAHHWPDVPLHCDVTKVDANELEVPDVILAGFPCQDVSQAGLRKGLHEGTRSNLFFEAVRIIRRLRDKGDLRVALFENVPGLFSVDDGIGFARCIRELLDVGCSDVAWTVLDAQHVGWCTSEGRRVRSVPQRRRRVFICATFGDTGEATSREIFSFSSRLRRDTSTSGEEGEGTPANSTEGVGGGGGDVSGTVSSKWAKGTGGPSGDECYNLVTTTGVDVYNGQVTGEVAASVTSASGISNATGPKVCSWNGDVTPKSAEDVSVTLRSQQGGEGTGVAFSHKSFGGYKEGIGTIRAAGGDLGGGSETKVTHSLQSTDGLDFKPAKDVSVTIKTGSGVGIPSPPAVYSQNMVVRRLTPKECCRLQAWPDDHLDFREELELEGNRWTRTGKVVEQADSPKYKQAGNGVASNCSEWIARRLGDVLAR